MKKPVIPLFAALLLTVLYFSPLFAAPKINDPRALNEWLYGYWQKPDPEGLAEAVRAMDRFKITGNGFPESDAFAAGFLSVVFENNQFKAARWLEDLADMPYPGTASVIWSAAVLSGSLEARRALKALVVLDPDARAFIKRLLDEPEVNFLAKDIEDARDCDLLWGRYFASGDKRYVTKIINALLFAGGANVSQGKREAAASARSYLIYYASKFPQVMQVCVEEEARQQGELKNSLYDIINSAKNIIGRR